LELLCGNCKEVVKADDLVYLTVINTVIHQRCYEKVKDAGTFKKIADKYPFFDGIEIR